VIPEPRDQQGHGKLRGSRGGRPVTYDPVALVYRGGAVPAAILAWLRTPRGDTP